MGATSNRSKQQWNAGNYTQLKVSVSPEIAAAFKARCVADGVSMASEISRFMSGKKDVGRNNKRLCVYSVKTRQQRNRAVKMLISAIDMIMDAEQQYMENIPENLKNSRIYEAAEQTVTSLQEASEILSEAY